MIGLLFLVMVAAALIAWYASAHGRDSFSLWPERQAHARDALTSALDRWVEAGLVERRQADSVVAFERGRAGPPRRISLLTEALGYVGAVLAVAGGGVALGTEWDDISDIGRVLIAGGAALLLLIGGWLLRKQSEPALERLMGVLWFLSAATLTWSAVLLFVDVFDVGAEGTMAGAGLTLSAYAAILWIGHRRVLQQLALFGGSLTAAIGILLVAIPREASAWVPALVVWAFGVAWGAAGWRGWLEPDWAAVPLGAGAALIGPSVGSEEHGWLFLLALATGAGLMALSIPTRQPMLLAVGAVGSFIYLVQSVVRYFGDTLGVPLALGLVGALVLVVAILVARAGSFSQPGHRPGGQHA